MTLLGSVLKLHEPGCAEGRTCRPGCVRDVEKFCGALLAKRGIGEGHSNYEDTLAYLVSEAWIACPKFDPDRDRGAGFSGFLLTVLNRKLVDAARAEYRTTWRFAGYVHERAPRPEFVPLEDERGRSHVDEPLAARGGDPASGRDPDLSRIFAGGSRRRARDLDELGLRSPPRAA